MKKLFQQVAGEDFTNREFFACAILSYGDEGFIHANGTNDLEPYSDIEIDELLELIKGKNCPSLAGKPKLIFIQTCPIEVEGQGPGRAENDINQSDPRKLPVEADFLKVHSLIPGSCSWKSDSQKPSLFIESLDEIIRKNRHLDILTLMTRMSNDLAKKIDGMKKSCDGILKKKIEKSKIPYVSSTLTTEVFFTQT